MAHMQRAGDVGRRNDNGVRFRLRAIRPARAEGPRLLPGFVNAAFDSGRLIRLVDHGLFRLRKSAVESPSRLEKSTLQHPLPAPAGSAARAIAFLAVAGF